LFEHMIPLELASDAVQKISQLMEPHLELHDVEQEQFQDCEDCGLENTCCISMDINNDVASGHRDRLKRARSAFKMPGENPKLKLGRFLPPLHLKLNTWKPFIHGTTSDRKTKLIQV